MELKHRAIKSAVNHHKANHKFHKTNKLEAITIFHVIYLIMRPNHHTDLLASLTSSMVTVSDKRMRACASANRIRDSS